MKPDNEKKIAMLLLRLENLKKVQSKIQAEIQKEESKIFPKHKRN